jgi:Ca2+-transporting ATPase
MDEGLFTRRALALSSLQGAGVLAIVLAVYASALSRGLGEADVRTLTFTTIVIANLGLILTNRSWTETIFTSLRSPNKALWWVFGGTLACLFLVLNVPLLRDLFRFGAERILDLLFCAASGFLSVVWFEMFKIWQKPKTPRLS